MDNDDLPVGRVMTRREVLALLGVAGVAVASRSLGQTGAGGTETSGGGEYPSCIVTPELTEGPYFVDENLDRSDLRSDTETGEVKEGAPLVLALRVFEIGGGCEPLANAQVDVWHCDALGVYSDVRDRSFDTTGQNWLRGYQVTDDDGTVRFTTVYPGWYRGRAVHIHFKVRGELAGESVEFTSQFFFDEDVTDVVHAREPYASKGYRTLLNERDGIFQRGGEQLLLAPTASSDGYTASFDIGLYTP